MRDIVVATANRNKVREIKEIMAGLPYNILSMSDAGIDVAIEETGGTFEENARIKAHTLRQMTGAMVLADDSGLEVDFLNGAPGVYSARFAGSNATYSEKIKKLLDMLDGVPAEKRTARFVCAAILIMPDGREICARGTCEGYIALEPSGTNGFGYDPVFYYPPAGKTLAQMTEEEKNRVSHRGKAMRDLAESLKRELHF